MSDDNLLLDKSLSISDKILELLSDENCTIDSSICTIVCVFFKLHMKKSIDIMNQSITNRISSNEFSIKLSENLESCEYIARNMLEGMQQADKSILLEYLIQERSLIETSKSLT